VAVSAASFRQAFPEFASGTRYPNAVVDFWLALAAKLINPSRWGNLAETGVYLYAAHNLVLERQAVDAAERGAVPGQATGAINNKSVDKVSVGYDTAGSAEEGGGQYNTTIYGQRYYKLVKMVGIGGIQVGVPMPTASANEELSSQNAWVGPWTPNFPNMNG